MRPRSGGACAPGARGRCCDRERSWLEPQVRVSDPDEVARGKLSRPAEPDAVDERAVGRSHVFDPDAVASRLDAGVVRGSVVVTVESDVVWAASADGDDRGIELVFGVLDDGAGSDSDGSGSVGVRVWT